jgi:ABC-type hemin transport system substrate-binding protein
VLAAAGARNAVAEDVAGPPSLSSERLLTLDPDAIVVLSLLGPRGAETARRFERFTTLSAVKNRRIGRLEDAAAFSHGPSVVGLVERLHQELVRIGALE